jgi:hypothetical protein
MTLDVKKNNSSNVKYSICSIEKQDLHSDVYLYNAISI